jgi:hypothetical protein
MDCAYFRASAIARTVPTPRNPISPIYPNGTRKRRTSMEHFGTYEDLAGNPGRRLGEEEHAHRRDLVYGVHRIDPKIRDSQIAHETKEGHSIVSQ